MLLPSTALRTRFPTRRAPDLMAMVGQSAAGLFYVALQRVLVDASVSFWFMLKVQNALICQFVCMHWFAQVAAQDEDAAAVVSWWETTGAEGVPEASMAGAALPPVCNTRMLPEESAAPK